MELTEKLLELIAKLVDLAPHVWATTIRQVYVDATAKGLEAVIFAILAAGCLRGFLGWRAKESKPNSMVLSEDREMAMLFYAILGAVCAFIVLMDTQQILNAALNPQWAAIKLWLGMIQ